MVPAIDASSSLECHLQSTEVWWAGCGRPEKQGSWSPCSSWLPGERNSTQLWLVVKSIYQSSNGRVGKAELWPQEETSWGGQGASCSQKEWRPEAIAHPILERDKPKFLKEPRLAARCCLGLNTCLPVLSHTHSRHTFDPYFPLSSPVPNVAVLLLIPLLGKEASEYSCSHFSEH